MLEFFIDHGFRQLSLFNLTYLQHRMVRSPRLGVQRSSILRHGLDSSRLADRLVFRILHLQNLLSHVLFFGIFKLLIFIVAGLSSESALVGGTTASWSAFDVYPSCGTELSADFRWERPFLGVCMLVTQVAAQVGEQSASWSTKVGYSRQQHWFMHFTVCASPLYCHILLCAFYILHFIAQLD